MDTIALIGLTLSIIIVIFAVYKGKDCEGLIGKIVRWIMFSIVLSLLPLGMKMLSLSIRNHNFSYSDIVSHGELLLITITMCTTAIAELFCSGSGSKPPKLFVGSVTILILILAASLFSDISVAFELGRDKDFGPDVIFNTQIVLFVLSFILGIACIFLSEH